MAAILRSLYLQAYAVRELTREIEAEACKRLLRKGDVPERVLTDLHAKACKHHVGHAKQLDELPTWISHEFTRITDRLQSAYRTDNHLEQPGYFAALAA